MRAEDYYQAAVRCTKAAIAAEEKYREAKGMFNAITDAYVESDNDGIRKLDLQSRAERDPRRIKAAGDAAWHREEATLYTGLANLMLRMEARELGVKR